MFEAAELGASVPKEEYAAQVPQLRVDLVNAQYDLRNADFPVLIVLVGDDRPGGNELLNVLNEWMDPRYVQTHVFGDHTDEERQRPRFWRYWRAVPGRGELAIFTGAWVLGTLGERLEGVIDDEGLDRRLSHMRQFERALIDDGGLVLKFWIHLPRKSFKKRLKKARKDPEENWQVDELDGLILDRFDELVPLAQRVLRKTDSGGAPWQIVEGTDARHRNLTVARAILDALQERLERPPPPPRPAQSNGSRPPSVLDSVDLGASITREQYKTDRDELQARLRGLTRRARETGLSSVLVFEGWDAAGKGGVIRRLTQAMTAQDYRIAPIAAPTDEELAHHYLWRFWRHLPRSGRMLIFDRSWYGRVLVERVEGLARDEEWQRAYAEINDFEEQLVEHDIVVLKFWLHLDPDEQLRRFQEREKTPYKKYKITDEDYRNRERWDDYSWAVSDMVAHTSTELAPWKLISAQDKRCARVEVLRTVCDALEAKLDHD